VHPEEGNYKDIELGIQAKRKETTKSAREIGGVRPQTRAQSNNKPKNNSIILDVEFLAFKDAPITFSPNSPH
jgi:hypothetical protein